jgi:hypothetical protein
MRKVRARKFVQGVMAGKSMKRAALAAGYPESIANHPGAKIIPHTIDEFRAELQRRIPIEKLSQRIAEGLDAKETKFFQHEGKVVETREVIAWAERRQYADLAATLKGLAVKEQEETEIHANAVILLKINLVKPNGNGAC